MFADLNNLMLCLLLFVNFVVADPDYLSSKFVDDTDYDNFDIHSYYQLHVCNAGGKWMAKPYNSTHYEYRYFKDEECTIYDKSEYYKGKYFDDITSILENCYAYVEQGNKELKKTAAYITYAHRYCNTFTKDSLMYIDYNDGFFYLNKDMINASLVIYPTCIATDESKSDTFIRFYRNTWRFPSYQRTNLGGKGMNTEQECDDADPLALVVMVIIGLLSF